MSITFDGELNTITSTNSTITLDVGSLGIPRGTTAERPNPAIAGMIRFNTTTNRVEGYNGTAWSNLI